MTINDPYCLPLSPSLYSSVRFLGITPKTDLLDTGERVQKKDKQWVDAVSVGRFWGYWGLIPATVKMEISDEHALFISRTLRRWQRANRQVAKTTVWRTNTKTGVMFRRSVNRRKKIVKGSRAFRLVPDGARFIELLSSQLG